MKWIQKSDEPQEILQWKQKFRNRQHRMADYSDLNDNLEIKGQLKASLLSEQGYICCYCSKRIGNENSHIEHFRPKGQPQYRGLSLDYTNLLASCQGFREREENCGHSKGNDFDEELLISPLDEDCETLFTFSNRGKIQAVDGNERAVYTIKTLQLDSPALNPAREEAMWASGAMNDIDEAECKKLLDLFTKVDENGRYVSFCDAIVYHLNKRLQELTSAELLKEETGDV